MKDLVAYELRTEYQGTTEQDGQPVPTFQGGVLFVGDGDFHLRDELDAGDGVITVRAGDGALVSLLDAVPALKRTTVPNGAEPVSPYKRRSLEALRFDAGMRGLRQAGSLSRARLEAALEAHDAAQLEGPDAVEAVAADPGVEPDAAPDADPQED